MANSQGSFPFFYEMALKSKQNILFCCSVSWQTSICGHSYRDYPRQQCIVPSAATGTCWMFVRVLAGGPVPEPCSSCVFQWEQSHSCPHHLANRRSPADFTGLDRLLPAPRGGDAAWRQAEQAPLAQKQTESFQGRSKSKILKTEILFVSRAKIPLWLQLALSPCMHVFMKESTRKRRDWEEKQADLLCQLPLVTRAVYMVAIYVGRSNQITF